MSDAGPQKYFLTDKTTRSNGGELMRQFQPAHRPAERERLVQEKQRIVRRECSRQKIAWSGEEAAMQEGQVFAREVIAPFVLVRGTPFANLIIFTKN